MSDHREIPEPGELVYLPRSSWLPALLATDLPHPDCDPKRLDMLGESFVAFRDTQGRIGILDEACRHRSANFRHHPRA